MNIYLDIDGVLLANDKQSAIGADEFIAYLVNNHHVYWLTTHYMEGSSVWVEKYLSRFFSKQTMGYIRQIRPTSWRVNKTEAIDFSKPFIWYDDELYQEERSVLIANNALSRYICINLADNSRQLVELTIPTN